MEIKDEKKLVKLAGYGDKEAFSELMHIYGNKIYGLSLKLTKEKLKAGELTQDAFVKAFNNIKKFKGTAYFSTWLYQITVNL